MTPEQEQEIKDIINKNKNSDFSSRWNLNNERQNLYIDKIYTELYNKNDNRERFEAKIKTFNEVLGILLSANYPELSSELSDIIKVRVQQIEEQKKIKENQDLIKDYQTYKDIVNRRNW